MTEAKAILTNYHALRERQYVGDMDATCALLDFDRAVAKAGLTDRQVEALRLVYGEGMTQKDAGVRLGVSRQATASLVERAIIAIDRYYGNEVMAS